MDPHDQRRSEENDDNQENGPGSRNQTPQRQEHYGSQDEEQAQATLANGQQEVTFEPVDPENFDTKSFFSDLDALSEKLHSESLHTIDNDFDADELNSMVSAVTVSMDNFKNYSVHSQAHLERLRDQIKVVKDRMYKKISQNPYDSKADQRVSCEQRELDAKLQHLNKELARATEELARAEQATIDTEQAATKAALLAQQSAEEARAIQAEYEGRKKTEAELRKREEERRAQEERLLQEQEQREQEQRRAEEARRANLRKDEHTSVAPVWEDWPVFTYRVDTGDFNQGIGCLVRGNNNHFKENMISCEVLDPLQSNVVLAENEELVSHIINITGSADLNQPSVILIPHCTSRASAMSREPVIKMDTPDGWVELKSQEVVLDSHKDLKFVQAEFTKMTKMIVVTRYKRDFLHFNKRGGTVHSTVDQRASFTAAKGCFQHKENFVLQIQPVDHNTIDEIRLKSEEGSNLLTTSAIMAMEWTSKEFAAPVIFNIPVPPNPVKAKKAAAMRAAKEAKMKNPNPPPPPADEEELKKRKERAKKTGRSRANIGGQEDEEDQSVHKPTRWYMGQYGVNDDDENDEVYLAVKDLRGKWHIAENIEITQIRIDLVQFSVDNPSLAEKFVVLRLKHTAEPEDGLEIAKLMEQCLTERVVNVILKQRSDNPYEVAVEIVLHTKAEKSLKRMIEQGFDEGPGLSKEIVLREGDHLTLDFRANIKCSDDQANLDVMFHSQMNNRLTFEMSEVDKFLQKSYHVYRGFVMLCKKEETVCLMPPKKNKKAKKEQENTTEEEPETEEQPVTQYTKKPCVELLVSIPKEHEQLEPPALKKAPVVLRNRDDCVNTDTLHQVASALGEEWHIVATYLGVKKMRLQAILRNNQAKSAGEDDLKYEMLMSWAKKVPKSTNKAKLLCLALHKGGRDDLAHDIKDMEKNFQRERKGLD